MTRIGYGFEKTVHGVPYDEVVTRISAALHKEGFGVLTEIDVKNTFKQKLDVDFRRYKILGACNPDLAHAAISGESHIGLLLPCNVVVQETENGDVMVSIADPAAMFALVNNDDIGHLAHEARERLRRALDSI